MPRHKVFAVHKGLCAEGEAVEYNFVQVLNIVKGIPDVKVTVAVTRTKGIGVEKVVTIVVTHGERSYFSDRMEYEE